MPFLVVLSLLLVAMLMTPALVSLVAQRRFPALERKQRRRAGAARGLVAGLHAWLALLVLVVSVPLWLIPPLVLMLPPLIWGWLTYRVMAFDALADHASADERELLLRAHRWPLLGIGVVSGYLGAAPSLCGRSGRHDAGAGARADRASVWLYTLVFAFSSLWFSHYCWPRCSDLRPCEPGLPAAIPHHRTLEHSRMNSA